MKSADENKHLKDAMQNVKQQAFYMRKALDEPNLRDALKYSAAMLGELRTSVLSPQRYYELYSKASDELRHLEVFFKEEHAKGRSMAELYELVQHAGNILPRLYLLVTVGSVYIKSKQAPAKEVLQDLHEMSRGLQHPVRGLFLRSYLAQLSRDKLPDAGSEYEGEGGTVQDAVDFVLANFTEMNKLWVRMQHQDSQRDRQQRERERKELQVLVGKNLLVLSQLEGVTLELYTTTVLPRVLEQLVNCKDEIAQYYLMDAVIQAFPDDFHLHTLDQILTSLTQLQAGIDVKTIVTLLLQRLAKHAASNPDSLPVFEEVDAFGKLNATATKLVSTFAEMPVADALSLFVALMNFVLRVHGDRLDYVDGVLASACKVLEGKGRLSERKAAKQLVALLSAPLEHYDSVVTVLELEHFPSVMFFLDHPTHRDMAVTLVQSVLKHGVPVNDPACVNKLLDFCAPLVRTIEGSTPESSRDPEEVEEEQNLMARLVHMLRSDDVNEMFAILEVEKKHFVRGGQLRLPFTMPPMVMIALQLVNKIYASGGGPLGAAVAVAESGAQVGSTDKGPQDGARKEDPEKSAERAGDAGDGEEAAQVDEKGGAEADGEPAAAPAAEDGREPTAAAAPVTCQRIFHFLYDAIESLTLTAHPDIALRLFLLSAQVASDCQAETIAYEHCTQAFTIYEEEIADTRAQLTALHLIIGRLQRCHVFSADNRDALVHKAIGYSARLLKKPDQCRAILACTHLFWSPTPAEAAGPVDAKEGAAPAVAVVRDGDSVLACLKRALRIANAAQQLARDAAGRSGPVMLFAEILNKYIYYFDAGNPAITPTVMQGLLELISTELGPDSGVAADPALKAYYASTLAHIRAQKKKPGPVGERYATIVV